MKGTKRLAVSDSGPDTNDTAQWNKRVMAGGPFDAHRSGPLQSQSNAVPPLDMDRAMSARQHVRALNAQFARWVQTELKNHPEELWEDGVRDYIAHASNITEKFSDVVKWLKANATKGGSAAAPPTTGKKFVPELESGQNLSSVRTAQPNSDDADEEDEIKQPGSPSLKKSEEEGIFVGHEVKCKLYVKSTDPEDKDPWKDKGTGLLSIKCKEGASKGTKESQPTIIVRNDVGKVLLNALLYPGIKTNPQKNSLVAIFHTLGDDGSNKAVARTFLIRLKTEDDRNKLAAAIQEHAPAS